MFPDGERGALRVRSRWRRAGATRDGFALLDFAVYGDASGVCRFCTEHGISNGIRAAGMVLLFPERGATPDGFAICERHALVAGRYRRGLGASLGPARLG